MISLQSHNQVLYHLSQLTAAFTPRTTTYSTRIKQEDGQRTVSNENLCQESFEEAVKNCTELSLEYVDLHKLSGRQRITKKRLHDIFDHLKAINQISRPIEDHDKWKVSYLCGSNFNDVKQSFPCSPLSTPIISSALGFTTDKSHRTNTNSYSSTPLTNVTTRGFKTIRNANADNNRNPTLTTRFRDWIGLPKQNGDKLKGMERADFENLKKIFNSTELTPDEKQHVKVAFAEGYMAGNDRKSGRGSKLMGVVRFMGYVVAGVVAFVAIVSVYRSNSNGSMFRIQLGKPPIVDPTEINVTFKDALGVDEAKEELMEIVEFLKNPEKFSALGGRLPKGVLLVGPPGTGKTLLARAVAGEARVPFFHAAGPEFDEILVGQGARRVRDLFKAAKERAPCVIFLDEIDSVGGRRTNSLLHPYANQTINQLLSEMDGFHQNEGVIVLGATNRRDDLDQALRRPGRFDVEIIVRKPDLKGRKEILEYYLSKVLTKSIDVEHLARTTIGFTGADIESMVNQAALRAASDGDEYISMDHLQVAREKIQMGPELKGRMPDANENRITAYHEAGHALVGYYTQGAQVLTKVTIVPRGESLGHTQFVMEKEIFHQTKSKLLASMDTAFGGRAAEELIFGVDNITTGASDDLERATRIAEAMVKVFGMSEKVGLRTNVKQTEFIINGNPETYSPHTTEIIDAEISRILQESYERAKKILKTHAKEHKLLAEALIKHETLDMEDIKKILDGDDSGSVGDKRQPIIDVTTNVL